MRRLSNRRLLLDTGTYDAQCRLWLMRLICGVRPKEKLLVKHFADEGVQRTLGIPVIGDSWEIEEEDEPAKASWDAGKIRRWLNTNLRKAEAAKISLKGTPLGDNIQWLGGRLGLSAVEQEVLAFAILLRTKGSFREALGSLGLDTLRQTLLVSLAFVTATTAKTISKPLSLQGALAQTGLLRLDTDNFSLDGAFVSPPGLVDHLMGRYEQPDDLLRQFFHPSPAPKLTKADFAHLDTDLRLLKQVLTQALRQREAGINILLYGEPGVGKSEFARLLAASVGDNLIEVSNADEEGDALSGEDRFASFMLCQHLLGKGGDSLVLFDEIEDVFPEPMGSFLAMLGLGKTPTQGMGKAWVNRVLETNPVPAIWIANRVGHIDPAYLRRFDYALEIPKPPKAVRLRVADKYFGGERTSKNWIARIADWEAVTPAQLERAARMARLARSQSEAEAEGIAERTLRLSARLLGQRIPGSSREQTGYRLDCLNTGLDIPAVIAGLRQRPSASFCFYGPPGTGKTALARHLAQALDRPLLVKRASDLLSKWVGEAEQNIAAMFQQAEQDDAVLVLDEADGLLADRREAGHQWEITQVNEMLTQMETFDGIFICTTNLLERLDQASLRRFAFKVRFDYLKPHQSRLLFQETWRRLNPQAVALDDTQDRRLARLDNLTPGDFATVARQWATLGASPEAGALIAALEEECRLKGGMSRKIGFTD
ncbi:MAG: AAA family ATPase [Gammaproteobacteria bacterium]|nr:AAA family ATPase [Gammaproteobacteria bacterium]MBU1653359.1 AAA family ATPase [Gammaproteobacteria bacterium]MBU1962786.1 AAA family ATPase [Gammaproteobacteria bacterium]